MHVVVFICIATGALVSSRGKMLNTIVSCSRSKNVVVKEYKTSRAITSAAAAALANLDSSTSSYTISVGIKYSVIVGIKLYVYSSNFKGATFNMYCSQ
jgi:hypothetical protein